MDEYNMTPADVVQRSKQYDEDGKGISKVNMSQWLYIHTKHKENCNIIYTVQCESKLFDG